VAELGGNANMASRRSPGRTPGRIDTATVCNKEAGLSPAFKT